MATGDVVFFNEAMAGMLDYGWEPADDMKLAICDNTVAPTASTTTPALGDFTEVGTGGTYSAGGTSLGNWGTLVSQSGGTVTIDSGTNPSWAQDAGNDADAYWGILYNDTDASDLALAFVDLGGPVDMGAGSLTVTWNASGIATITKT